MNQGSRESNSDSEQQPETLFRRRVERLERLAWWMDDAFEIPFLKWRIGLDALFGFIPGFGDLVGAVIAVFVVFEAVRLKVSAWVIAQMGLNVILEFLIGAIPVIGDFLDIHFKANRRNVTLLKGAGISARSQATSSRWAVIMVLVLFLAGLVATGWGVVWLMSSLWNWAQTLLT